jgi:hypothetical protein
MSGFALRSSRRGSARARQQNGADNHAQAGQLFAYATIPALSTLSGQDPSTAYLVIIWMTLAV